VKIDDKLSRNNLLQENISKVKYLNYLFQEKAVLNMDNMTADIVIPIYNAYDFTVRCIELVYKNTDVNYNLYLINDCSTDVRIGAFLDDLAKKERPRLLKKLLIINNEENMGFIKSVNKALRNTENHVVLLNTDTEVPPEWLKRLLYPLVEDEMTATVTPFSNSATICSYPNFCEDNALPTGFSSSSLDAVFKKYGGQAFIEIPTGVGFCMAMRKQLIKEIGGFDTIYGKGYGEENDWCRHAVKNGYRNVMVTDLFVYHKHGVSFNEQKEKKRQDRINENLQILNERYPDYGRRVNDFIASDPLRIVRDFIKIICKARQNTAKEGILFINHSLGGGATVYQEKIIAQWQKEKRIYKIELLADFKTLRLTQYDNTEKEDFYFDFEKLDEAVFSEIIKALEINSLYINQLVNYPPEKIIRLIKAAGLPYTFFIHDFYAVCPEYNLLNEKSIYCGAETDLKKCRDCLARQKNLICKDISLWRQNFKGLLLGAQEVLAPSNSAADIVNKYYPEVEIGVREHTVADWVRPTFEKKFWQMDIFNIAVLGAIGENKGSKIVYELARLLKKKNIPAKITVIGFTDLQNEALIDERLEITGRYDNRAVSELLAKHHIALVLIPSICPETYSYTAGEAVGSGYPLMTFDIGAPAERIRRDKCGWIIEKCSAEAVLEKLENILANKEKYLEEFLHE
jgi:GT2 family glycosyltransferase/glycosyltransferase involved in cell wall biosynthesis